MARSILATAGGFHAMLACGGVRNICFILLFIAAGYLLISRTGLRNFERGPYLQSVAPDSVWVVWDTSEPCMGSVEYGSTSALGQVITDEQALTHHAVQLVGLEPYTSYSYRVDDEEAAQFRSAASAAQTNFRFVVFGDTREGISVHNRQSPAWCGAP